MELWIGAINLGFLYAFMAVGVFVTFRIYDFPDITVDGSFVTGAAITAIMLVAGINPILSLSASFIAGAAAGCLTALIHTRFKINGLLAGILVMTGLYSVNLRIMGRSNIPLISQPGVITYLRTMNPGLPDEIWLCLCLFFVIAFFWSVVSVFFKTDLGITMRATGNNPAMAAASGVDVNMMKVFGISIANGLVGVSGSLVAQYQGFADIGMGLGAIVFGLAAVIIGESLIKARSMYVKVLSVIIGSIMFRLMVALALYVGLDPVDLKLVTAAFVLMVLVAPKLLSHNGMKTAEIFRLVTRKRLVLGICAAAVVFFVSIFGYRQFRSHALMPQKIVRIGVFQVSDHALLNASRDGFVEEMKRLGYENGKNCLIQLENANGDLSIVNSILDKFQNERMDIIVPISTACAQASINRIKDRPVVFTTVANPFIIGAGKTDTDHLPNVTGVYEVTPMDEMMKIVTRILPGKLKIGAIWDPAHANSVYNVESLTNALSDYKDISFVGATVTNSSEVYQAAVSLTAKGIDAFVLPTDNIVYSAFESVVKAAQSKKIPVFITDVERLKDGALAAYGYDYTSSGIQAARIVDRVLKGETPARIPFEKNTKEAFGINLIAARELGITVPADLLEKATIIHDVTENNIAKKRLALFLFSDNLLLTESAGGVMDEFKRSGILGAYNITVDLKNAQNDFGTANAVVQDIVRQNYDYIVTLSTPALQVTANGNKRIPHIFGTVTDPYNMGIAKDRFHHIPNITGVATFQPVETTIKVMRELFPAARRIGVVWNPAEACSEACTYKAREAAKKYNFELVEATISSTGEVKDAVQSLLNKRIDLFLTSGDNTVILALETIAGILRQHKIPYFTNTLSDVQHGAFITVGADYYEVGIETAKMAERVIKGEYPKDMPIYDFVPEKIGLNLALAREYGITISEAFRKKASVIKQEK